MSRLHAGAVILEGITHIEDLPLEKFMDTVEKLKDKIVTEKLDGANLWFGVDENGFFTSREGKSKANARFYSVDDYPMVANYNGFRAAHLALEQVKNTILKVLQPGDIVEIEVLFGRQPNTVTYGADNLNYIVILRGIGVDSKKVDSLGNKLDDTTVNVTSTVIASPDGDQLEFNKEQLTWQFTQVKPVDNQKINSSEALMMLQDMKKFLNKQNEAFPSMSNKEVAEVKLGSVDKAKRDAMKAERERVLGIIMTEYKIPIKETLLNNYVRKIKPRLQARDLEPSEDVGMEGVVLRDKDSDDQVKLVDKDVFTAMNTFNNFIRGNISGLVRTNDQDAPIELRGGAFGQAKIRIAELLGMKELAVSSTAKKTLQKFQGETVEETAENIARSVNINSVPAVRTKISAILSNAVEEVDAVLTKFKAEADTYKLKLKTGKEIGLSAEVLKRNLTAFAETKRDINQIDQAIDKAETPAQLIMALYGRTIQSLFKGSNNVKESFSLLKQLSEEGSAPTEIPNGHPVATPTTTADAIAPVTSTSGKQIVKRKRNFVMKKKFAKPTNESLLKLVEFDVANQNATDVDDSAVAKNDIEFKQLRNNVTLGNDVTDADVNRYLDKAHELNDEVDTITFGMEMDDGSIVKVYVNAAQADGFEDALGQMLGEIDDVEEVINSLAATYDIVDVEWPQGYQSTGETPVGVDVPDAGAEVSSTDGAEVVSTTTDTTPDVNPVIDLGNVEDEDEESDTPADGEGDLDADGDLGIDNTFFGDGDAEDNPSDDIPADGDPTETPDEEEPEEESDADADASAETSSEEDPPADDEDAVIGGEVATDDTPADDATSDEEEDETEVQSTGDEEEDEESEDEDAAKSKKKEESAMTIGQQFKMKLLAEKATPKKKDKEEEPAELQVPGLPVAIDKLLQSFPNRGSKAMVILLYLLGVPADALTLKKADLRKSVEEAGEKYMKDSQFRVWVKRLSEELTKVGAVKEAALEDELGNAIQRMILEIMQKIGLPESVERLARASLRNSIREKAKLAMSNAKVRQYLKIIAEMLGVDAQTGMVKEGKNHMGEQEYTSYASWKAAAKKKYPDVWFDGDKDIGQAMIGAKPFAKGKTVAVGEWDGEVGSIYKDEDVKKHKISESISDDKFYVYYSDGMKRKSARHELYFSKGFASEADAQAALDKAARQRKDDEDELDLIHSCIIAKGSSLPQGIVEAAPAPAAPAAQAAQGEEQTGNEWVDEIMTLVQSLGIPAAVLDYRRKQTELAVKQNRQNMSNYALVLRNIKKLNQIIGGNLKEDADLSEAEDFKPTDRYVSNMLRNLESSLPRSCRYKNFDFSILNKTVEWVTQESTQDESKDAAKTIAAAFKKAGLKGWTIKVVLRDLYHGDDTKWQKAKS